MPASDQERRVSFGLFFGGSSSQFRSFYLRTQIGHLFRSMTDYLQLTPFNLLLATYYKLLTSTSYLVDGVRSLEPFTAEPPEEVLNVCTSPSMSIHMAGCQYSPPPVNLESYPERVFIEKAPYAPGGAPPTVSRRIGFGA